MGIHAYHIHRRIWVCRACIQDASIIKTDRSQKEISCLVSVDPDSWRTFVVCGGFGQWLALMPMQRAEGPLH